MKCNAAVMLFAALAVSRLWLPPAGSPAVAEGIRIHLHRHKDEQTLVHFQGADRAGSGAIRTKGLVWRHHQRAWMRFTENFPWSRNIDRIGSITASSFR
jgi:hypothetical protein